VVDATQRGHTWLRVLLASPLAEPASFDATCADRRGGFKVGARTALSARFRLQIKFTRTRLSALLSRCFSNPLWQRGSLTRNGSTINTQDDKLLPWQKAFMSKLLLTGLTHPGTFELEPGFNAVGRNPTNDFRLQDATVSSFHCEIVVSEDSVLVRDLGSTNGTYIDGQAIVEAQLKPDQILRLGSAELRLEEQPVAQPAPVAIPEVKAEQSPSSVALPDGSLSCLNHREVRAIMECGRCQKVFCVDCVHVLRLSGGKTRVFCPSCSGLCEPLPGTSFPDVPFKPKQQSFFGRLSQTIRIRWK